MNENENYCHLENENEKEIEIPTPKTNENENYFNEKREISALIFIKNLPKIVLLTRLISVVSGCSMHKSLEMRACLKLNNKVLADSGFK